MFKKILDIIKKFNEKVPKNAPHYIEIFGDGSGTLSKYPGEVITSFTSYTNGQIDEGRISILKKALKNYAN